MKYYEETLFAGNGFDCYRIPSVAVSNKGTVFAFTNDRHMTYSDHAAESSLVMRRKLAGGKWEDIRVLAFCKGWAFVIGSAVYDPCRNSIMCLYVRNALAEDEFKEKLPEAERKAIVAEKEKTYGFTEGTYIAETLDDGLTWITRKTEIKPNKKGLTGWTHGSAAGFVMKYGKYAGRLICPARYALHPYKTWEELAYSSSNTVIYSDDGGFTWLTGGTVMPGTGEGAAAERSDGSILYNSRAYFGDSRRYSAVSYDGGDSFTEQGRINELIEPCCNAALLRAELPDGKMLFLFSNPQNEKQRVDMTVRISYDEGKTWPAAKMISSWPASYSSLCYSKKTGLFTLLYECGVKDCCERIDAAEFDADFLKITNYYDTDIIKGKV